MKLQIFPDAGANFRRMLALVTLMCMATGLTAPTHAQVFRIIAADGNVSFSDQPPSLNSSGKAVSSTVSGSGISAAAGLPFELRQVATKFPVTLYSSEGCVPCGSGRAMLTSRGIPFTERTVNSPEDGEALKRLSGASVVPLLTIGSQHLKGFSEAEWTQFLDAAGYPTTSRLPAAFRLPQAMPLVLANTAPLLAPSNSAQSPAATATKTVETPVNAPASAANPAGIRF
jgi:glutaredoxin